MEEKLKLAVKHIKAGDKETGKELLMELLKAEPENDKAWVWMSAVVETDELRQECLKEALMYNPFNEVAQRGLAKIKERSTPNPQSDNGRGPAHVGVSQPAKHDNWNYAAPPLQPVPKSQEFQPSNEPFETAAAYVVKELARFTRKENIATNLAVTGMNYDEALKFVSEIEVNKRREIELRRMPLVIALCGVLTFMGGVWTMSIFVALAQGGIPSIFSFIFGVPMFVSGIVGLIVSIRKIL